MAFLYTRKLETANNKRRYSMNLNSKKLTIPDLISVGVFTAR